MRKIPTIFFVIFLAFGILLPAYADPGGGDLKELKKQLEDGNRYYNEYINAALSSKPELRSKAGVIYNQLKTARENAVRLASRVYGINITEIGEFPVILKYPGAIGGMLGSRGTFLSESAFKNPGWLGASILQLVVLSKMKKTDSFPDDSQQSHLDAIAAFDAVLAKAGNFSLTIQEKNILQNTRQWHFEKLAFKYRRQVTGNKNYRVSESSGDLETLTLPDALYGGLVSMQVTEGGKGSGDIFKLKLRRLTGRALNIDIPYGTVFFPPDPADQPRTVIVPLSISLKMNSEQEVDVEGVCLEPEKKIPEKGSIATGYEVWDINKMNENSADPVFKKMLDNFDSSKFNEYLQAVKIIEKGKSMEKAGQFKGFLGKNHELIIIQWAVWAAATKNDKTPMTKNTLQKEISQQYKAAGRDIPPGDISKLTDEIWGEVSGLLKESDESDAGSELIDILKQKTEPEKK